MYEETPEYVKDFQESKKYANPPSDAVACHFPDQIDVPSYWAVCRGKIVHPEDPTKRIRVFNYFRFLRGRKSNLTGAYELEYNGEIIETDTLVAFKRNILKHTDSVLFEKCTFLDIPEKKWFLKLMIVKSKLRIPNLLPDQTQETEVAENSSISELQINVVQSLITTFQQLCALLTQCGYQDFDQRCIGDLQAKMSKSIETVNRISLFENNRNGSDKEQTRDFIIDHFFSNNE